ncbi:MAG: dihydroorotase [Patescibacteria group bacterium]
MSKTITLKKPFDAHVHLRRGAMLRAVTPLTAAEFGRAIIMPNTEPPIETVEQAAEYKKEILAACGGLTSAESRNPQGDALRVSGFEPLMTLYLTKNLTPAEIEKGIAGDVCKISAVKSYPYGATTNSQWGYRSILEAANVLKKMEEVGMPLLLHGEVHLNEDDEEEDPYDGERLFITDVLPRLLDTYPKLKVSLEHLSSENAAAFIEKNGEAGRLVATVTPHHLLYGRHEAESNPLLKVKPLIKDEKSKNAVRALVAKGLPFVFAGTDSAPHPEAKKLSPTGAFGIFSAPAAVELYTQVFEELGALDKLENFLSVNGPRFYGLEPSSKTITLMKKDWQVTEPVVTDEGDKVWPICNTVHGSGSETIHWQIQN